LPRRGPSGSRWSNFPAGPSGDVDGDGRLDLLLINWFAGNHTRLLLGASGEKAHWLRVRAQGAANTEKGSNRIGIGSEVRLYKPGTRALIGLQQIQTGYGYASGQPAASHFGLGKTEQVDVEVTFPSGQKVTQRGVAADRKLTIKEPQ